MTHPAAKQRLIYEGVLSLLRNGTGLYQMKVADIAAAAGIGKGTVYEYFESKEEVVARALVYLLEKELHEAAHVMQGAEGFQGKLFAVLDYVAQNVHSSQSAFHLLSKPDLLELKPYLCGSANTQELFARLTGEIRFLAALGEAEGLFPKQAEDYLLFAASSALSGYLKTVLDGQMPLQKAKQYTLRALVGMLAIQTNDL